MFFARLRSSSRSSARARRRDRSRKILFVNGSPGNLPRCQLHAEDAEIARLRRQQALLAKFGSYAFTETDIHSVLTEAARICAEGLGVPFCKICRYRSDENDLLVEAGVGWHRGCWAGCFAGRCDFTARSCLHHRRAGDMRRLDQGGIYLCCLVSTAPQDHLNH